MKNMFLGLLAVFPLLVPAAHAQETQTYAYDVLGRLVATSTSGGPNNGITMSTAFDSAGNRTNYTVSGASPPPAQWIPLTNSSLQVISPHQTNYVCGQYMYEDSEWGSYNYKWCNLASSSSSLVYYDTASTGEWWPTNYRMQSYNILEVESSHYGGY